MRIPFAEIRPNFQQNLAVGGDHVIAYTESGNAEGLPVIIIHGGPGAGASEYSRRLFNPEVYRIIQFDQRGCGASSPHCSLLDNNANELMKDIYLLQDELGIKQSVLSGGSWGATLALLYAQKYPERVTGLILRGCFLARKQDLEWLYDGGAGRIFPDHWRKFTQFVDQKTGPELISAYHEILTGDNELQRMAAAKHWSTWEANCSSLTPNPHLLQMANNPKEALPFAVISTHFMGHNCFVEPNQILKNMEKIDQIPGFIIHGRYDMVCPLDNAFDLFASWSNAELDIVREAGHADVEAGITDAVIKATQKMSQRLGFSPKKA